jgi:hypothetical protein
MNSVKASLAGMALVGLTMYIGIWAFKLFGGC